MTKGSMKWRNYNRPFLLQPVGKDYLWGGKKLKEYYGKESELEILAESWECSTHPEGISLVKSGIHAGMSLKEVITRYPEYLGTHPKNKSEIPILIKFIDAREKLSIQVHPDDEYAFQNENGSLGKTEMWYVVEAEDNAELVYGFYQDVDEATVRKSLKSNAIEKYLHKVKVKRNDVFYIEAGTIHAVGAGMVLLEVQENSNLTYRLYDYERVDKNGRKRTLHIDKAIECINFSGSNSPRQPMRVLKYEPGCASEILCRCEYFQVERMLVNTTDIERSILYQTGINSFQVLVCLEGEITLKENHEEHLNLVKGDCVFIPANSTTLELTGKAQMIKVSC